MECEAPLAPCRTTQLLGLGPALSRCCARGSPLASAGRAEGNACNHLLQSAFCARGLLTSLRRLLLPPHQRGGWGKERSRSGGLAAQLDALPPLQAAFLRFLPTFLCTCYSCSPDMLPRVCSLSSEAAKGPLQKALVEVGQI